MKEFHGFNLHQVSSRCNGMQSNFLDKEKYLGHTKTYDRYLLYAANYLQLFALLLQSIRLIQQHSLPSHSRNWNNFICIWMARSIFYYLFCMTLQLYTNIGNSTIKFYTLSNAMALKLFIFYCSADVKNVERCLFVSLQKLIIIHIL